MRKSALPFLAIGLILLATASVAAAQAPLLPLARPASGQAMPAPIALGALTAVPPARLLRPDPAAASPGLQCRQAIAAAERVAGIPTHLMAAIGRVESGRREPDGTVNPWPWSINAEGTDHIFDTKAEAVAAVRAFQARGMRSIDVGCMQVNLLYHPDAFASLEEAFDPPANASFAARFLTQLHDQTGTWPTATAWYHSATPGLGADYQRKVAAVLPEEQRREDDSATAPANVASLAGGLVPVRPGGTGRGAASGSLTFASRAEPARMIPLPAGAAPGRGLAAYRAMPIAVVGRPPPRGPTFGPASTPG